jgi:hypothetical protein
MNGAPAPETFLRRAVKRMPWLTYAEAAVAVCAAVAIIRSGFRLDPLMAYLSAALILGLMFILVDFKRYAEGKEPTPVGRFIIWSSAVVAVLAVCIQITCHFWPRVCFQCFQPVSSAPANARDEEMVLSGTLECPTRGNHDDVYCPLYEGEFSSGATFTVSGKLAIVRDTCDPEWRDGNLALYCNKQESDRKNFIIPREMGKGVPVWRPGSEQDNSNFSLKCSARPFLPTALTLTAHPRGCSNMQVTNLRISSRIE